jgi:hypothetical protein
LTNQIRDDVTNISFVLIQIVNSIIYFNETVTVFDSRYIILINYNSSKYRDLAKFGFQIFNKFLINLKLAADNVNLLLKIIYVRGHNVKEMAPEALYGQYLQ